MITGNEQAYPTVKTDEAHTNRNIHGPSYGNTYSVGGLTIRQHFAAMAMQGMLSNPKIIEDVLRDHKGKGLKQILEVVALDAIDAADVLITELNKPEPCPSL